MLESEFRCFIFEWYIFFVKKMIFTNSKNSKLEISQVYDIRLQIRKVVATSNNSLHLF